MLPRETDNRSRLEGLGPLVARHRRRYRCSVRSLRKQASNFSWPFGNTRKTSGHSQVALNIAKSSVVPVEGNRTPTPCGTRFCVVRVYQFRHTGYLVAHDLIGKPAAAFPDHALGRHLYRRHPFSAKENRHAAAAAGKQGGGLATAFRISQLLRTAMARQRGRGDGGYLDQSASPRPGCSRGVCGLCAQRSDHPGALGIFSSW